MLKWLKYILLTLLSGPLIYVLWLLLRCFTFDYFTIPSSSMSPLLVPGDQVIVNKLLMGPRIYTNLHFVPTGQELKSYRLKGLRSLLHNDVVIFNFPHHDNKISFLINNVYCKRIVGMPGDSLSIINGHYHNNNYEGVLGNEDEQIRLEDTPDSVLWSQSIWTIPYHHNFPWTIRNFGPMYIPRKGDIITITPYEATLYKILLEWEIGQPVGIDWESKTVWRGDRHFVRHQWQHNYYFMAGDNVLDSYDSRYWGLVPEEYIVGVVKQIIKNEQ